MEIDFKKKVEIDVYIRKWLGLQKTVTIVKIVTNKSVRVDLGFSQGGLSKKNFGNFVDFF